MLAFGDVHFTDYQPRHFPFRSPPLIAPFWYDLNPRAGGNISYRQTNDSTILKNVRSLLLELGVEEVMDFSPIHIFIVTWNQVPAYNGPLEVNKLII